MSSCLAIGRLALTMALLALTGCATYSDSFGAIKRNLSARQYDAALANIEKQAKSDTDRALYLLNKGMVLRMKRDFVASNQALEAAKTEMERLYAASVTENTLSFLVNDATVSYAGDDYEQVLVHLYLALNYLELGQPQEARVEALQVDVKLREIGEKIPDSKFTEDALSRYLTGLIYEGAGEWSDAMIAYRKAYEAYKKYQSAYGTAMPPLLKQDLLRLSQRLGLTDELAQYEKEFAMVAPAPQANDAKPEGELVFVLNNGLAPIKRERATGIWAPPTASVMVAGSARPRPAGPPVLVNIALPFYLSHPNPVFGARISIAGKQASTQLMEDIDAIARASLDARMPAITARSIARAIAKGAVQKAVDRAGANSRDSDLAAIGSILVRVATIATERADTRSWLTLPANVQLARLALPAGSHTIRVELLGAGGGVIASQDYAGIVIRSQQQTYLSQHWVAGN
jgi:hypothetical protein